MDNNLLWSNFLKSLKNKISPVSFDTWFKNTKIIRQDKNKLYIEVPMSFHKTFLKENYSSLIEEILFD